MIRITIDINPLAVVSDIAETVAVIAKTTETIIKTTELIMEKMEKKNSEEKTVMSEVNDEV